MSVQDEVAREREAAGRYREVMRERIGEGKRSPVVQYGGVRNVPAEEPSEDQALLRRLVAMVEAQGVVLEELRRALLERRA